MKPQQEPKETHFELSPELLSLNKGMKLQAIKTILNSLQSLSNQVDRLDIAAAIRSIINGDGYNLNPLMFRYTYGFWDKQVITLDNRTGLMTVPNKFNPELKFKVESV